MPSSIKTYLGPLSPGVKPLPPPPFHCGPLTEGPAKSVILSTAPSSPGIAALKGSMGVRSGHHPKLLSA